MTGGTRAGVVFRWAMAAVGLGLIVTIIALNWSDRMVLPAGRYENIGTGQQVEIAQRQNVEIYKRSERLIWVGLADRPKGRGLVLSRSRIGGEAQPYIKAGMVTTLGRANHWLMLAGLIMVGLTLPIQALRWWVLMRTCGLAVGYGWAFRLTMVGQFFNVSMPGATGGDVLKAYYAATKQGQRATAVMSVLVDRVAGLVGLVLLAGLAGLWALDEPLIRWITLGIWLGLGGMLLLTWLYLSPKVRTRVGMRGVVDRLPGKWLLKTLDDAAVAYRGHLGAVAGAIFISLPIHVALVGSTILAGKALGMEQSALQLLALIPLVFVLASIPISPAGLGVMEGAAVLLIDAPPTQVLGMILIFRLFQIAYALLGGTGMLRGNIALHAPEAASAQNQAQ